MKGFHGPIKMKNASSFQNGVPEPPTGSARLI
jgi:hypothetical protein